MGFHFNKEGDSTNYGPNATHYKLPFPSADALPRRDGRNTGNAYVLTPTSTAWTLWSGQDKRASATDARVLTQFTTA